ncbi:hypothetical protein C8J56DRAFT_1127435 [Mycena floridula]|nr:hypothetical protein C8J56DRAFT_1127435 [Mycena floridula]
MHLDIPELLASSALPTGAERVYLNQLLDTSNHEISRLTTAIDELVLEREKLQSNVVAYKAVLAPIRLLPEDMLREIFVSCLPSNKPANIAITDAPLLLGRICRSWRELALSTPELWASIHVHFLHPFDTIRVQRLCDEARAWIARSGTSANEFLDSLTKLSKRWHSIDIVAPPEWRSSLISLSKGDVPRLDRFSYSVTGMERDAQAAQAFWQSLRLLEGQSLHDVSLQNIWVRNPVAVASNINFEQLTRLDFDGSQFTTMNAADILRRCPNLIACRMSISDSYPINGPSNFQPLTLAHLTSFAIDLAFGFPYETSTEAVLDGFFSSLDLPQLISFYPYMGIHISWLALARASPIENLTLTLSDLDHQPVLEYLRTSASLKRLRFGTWPSMAPDNMPGHELDVFMAIDDANAVICPFLEALELPNFGFPEEIFVKLVKRRAAFRDGEGKAHLKVVRASFNNVSGTGIQLDVLSQLDDLMTSGLSLAIAYYRYLKQDPIAYWPCQLPELEWT